MIGFGKMAASVAGPLVLGAGAAEAVTDAHVKLLVYLAGTVVAVISVVTWVRHEIRGEIKSHGREDAVRHETVLAEIRHIKELFELEMGVRERVITGEFPIVRKPQGG